MSIVLDAVEERLVAGYRRQAAQYDHALRYLEASARHESGADCQPSWVPEIQQAFAVVAELDMQLATDKAVWQHSGRNAGAELSETLDRVAMQIRTLSDRIDGAIAALASRSQQLAPEIDRFVRQRSMLHAYAQHDAKG